MIASFGERNLGYLNRVVEQYQSMSMTVDIIVVSEAPKQLAAGVAVVVGLPSSNPWSLPFAHKRLFVENLDRYDLFIYSEDDIGVTEENIRAFVSATDSLRNDEVAGFLRYETDKAGAVWMPDVHSSFHWEPDSVVDRGAGTFAKFTNEHAAFYILTQAQLRVAIASGGFDREPYEGKYDMLCAAATDPYTSCGLQKVVCISDLRSFLIRHMSDRYAGRMGLSLACFEQQLATLQDIKRGAHPATTLCEVESKLPRAAWSKSFYEKPHDLLLASIPATAASVLSIGCGWGATEAALRDRGAMVVALPLDSVIGAAAVRRGVNAIYGELDDCLNGLGDKRFDCVLVTNLLHLQRDPDRLFARCVQLVHEGGSLVIDSPNLQRIGVAAQRLLRSGPFQNRRGFSQTGINALDPGSLVRLSQIAGMSGVRVAWYDHSLPRVMGLHRLRLRLGRLTASGWVFRATRRAGLPSQEASAPGVLAGSSRFELAGNRPPGGRE